MRVWSRSSLPRPSASAVVVLALLLAGPAAADQPPQVDDWKFEVLRLKTGRSFRGLVLEETPNEVAFKYVLRKPGERTAVITTALPARDIERIDRLDERERNLLRDRLNALDPTGKGELLRMEALKLRPVPWGAGQTAGLAFDSAYFTLVSNAQEEIVRRAVVRLEQIYSAYARFLPPRHKPEKPTRIVLVRSLAEYHDLLRGQGRSLLNPAFYDPLRNEIVCASELEKLGDDLERVRKNHQELRERLKENEAVLVRQYKGKAPPELLQPLLATRQKIDLADARNERAFDRATERLFRTLYHEAFHAYLATAVYPPREGRVPPWLNEGLAQIFESAILEAGELRVGHAEEGRLLRAKAALRKGELVPLAELLRADHKLFRVGHASDRLAADRSYLTAWALAFYLTFDRHKLGTAERDPYIRACKRGGEPLSAFQELVGQPLPSFEKAFHQYLLALRTDGSVGP